MIQSNATCFFVKAVLISLLCLNQGLSAHYDTSYSPLNNGGAEQGMKFWHATGVQCIHTSAPEGQSCFELTATAESSAILRSALISIRPGESLRLDCQVKTATRLVNAYAAIRSYAQDKTTLMDETRFDIPNTEGQWSNLSHVVTAHPAAFYVTVQFLLHDPGTAQLDAVTLHRQINVSPLYANIKPLSSGDTLTVFKKRRFSQASQNIAIGTLQGTLARLDRPHIWIDAGDNTFVDNFTTRYGIQFNWDHATDWAAILGLFRTKTSGQYVLYDIKDAPSISAATTLAGLVDGVAIDVTLEPTAQARGYTMALDVRGKDCRWVYEHYRDKLNLEGIVVHTNDRSFHPSVDCLIDWSPATQTLCWWYNDEAVSREVYRSMAPASPVYGWQDPTTKDEGLSVKLHSEEGLFQMPSDWMLNLSVHASMGSVMKDKTFQQKVDRALPPQEAQVHYVTFIMSDMDNILTEIGTDSFFSTRKFYANPHRGQFPMTWGMAPALVELSPTAVELWYDHATPNDAFIAYCGPGYFYPNAAPYLQTHAARVSEYLKRADLKTLLLIDRVQPDRELTQDYYQYIHWFTDLEQIRGLFYLEYVCYAPHKGKIFWFDGKPMVTARFDFRRETFYPSVRPTAKSLADSINALPRDPASEAGYTMVTVHAWSKGLDDVYDTIQQLDPNVRVVHAETFIELLHRNVKPK
ncbi:MAG: hypothetical protein K9N55_21160 [Phycisphaerae bacterium]|nr:hypothetical protein [Phycisphaerae bacterium]